MLKGCYKHTILTISVLSFFSMFSFQLPGQEDRTHFSRVFNREKPYRIFLPEDYNTSNKHYPVIYYFHGNTGTHELDIEGVDRLVKQNGVILAAWNGRSVDGDLRPYNIGNHSNINYPFQFKDYFAEFVSYIDSTYRTIPDRFHRAIIGHSMGGIMSLYLAGKYPDLVGTAYNSKGSPEFFIGYPSQHSLYHVRYMFGNLLGVRLGFANSTDGELHNLNKEVVQGALRENSLNFTGFVYKGGHAITPDQFKDAFDFVITSFKNPLPDPERWHHSDLYPEFDIRGYEVRSNLTSRGFIEMKGVTKTGFSVCTKAWEPDGISIPGVKITMRTPAIYRPDTRYTLLDYNEKTDTMNFASVMSDERGKITVDVDHDYHQIGIWQPGGKAEITLASYRVNGSGLFLEQRQDNNLGIRLLNRGGSEVRGIKITLFTHTEGVTIKNPVIELPELGSGKLAWLPLDFKITAGNKPTKDGSPFRIRFNLTISDDRQNVWHDEFDAPVYYDVPEFTHIGIDDGDSEIFGSGNGNNIAEPGETVMIYEISNGSHRLRLYYDDPCIDAERLYDEIQPDKWGDGYTLSSLIHISKDCPPGHKIKFLASYEIKDWQEIRRDVTWGIFTMIVGDRSQEK
jgi:pimeloyl-ACP methyl ester carboxylesterase